MAVDPNARDAQQRRLYPWLQPALKQPRFKINDKRQFLASAYTPSCLGSGELMHGVGERVSVANGRQTAAGTFQGTLTLEWNGWPTHTLASSVVGILVQEVLGYDVTYFETGGGGAASQRMSPVGKGTCTPTHLNAEIWAAAKLKVLNVYANESTAGSNGYVGQSGWFTLSANVAEAWKGQASTRGSFQREYSADFYQEFLRSTELVDFFAYDNATSSAVAQTSVCPDGTMGCLNGCSKSHACNVAEAQGKKCLLVAMMEPGYDPGYLQAAIANNDIPAYFCFSGYDGMQNAVVDAMTKNGTITFYHFEPDLFHLQYEGKIQRIELPRALPKIVATATGNFGENGYGQPTTNPVSVDFPEESLKMYYSNVLNTDPFLVNFLNKFQLAQLDINGLLQSLVGLSTDATVANAPFAAACQWIQANYMTWRGWVDALPVCTLASHMQFSIGGCDNSSAFRNVSFKWVTPHPANASLPYVCDGGSSALPRPLLTSRSCDWLNDDLTAWSGWIQTKPLCDSTFYKYEVSPCDASATRAVTFSWLLPQPANATMSVECAGAYSGMVAFAITVLILLVASFGMIVVFRERPVIKRAQWPLLAVMVFGGMCICMYVLLGAGAPSDALCASRPVTLVLGYTFIFGSLLVKGLRVYWVFMNKAMKKVKIGLAKIVKILLVMLTVDVVILVAWLAGDFPAPTTETKKATEFIGTVDHVNCASSSFIFTALLLFWKAIITFGGIYVSFLIRHAGSDFQESIWIFASACVVLLAALVLLPLAFVVELAPAVAYTFQSAVLLIGTMAVMGLMLGPKFYRLNAVDKSSGSTATSAVSRTVSTKKSIHVVASSSKYKAPDQPKK